MGLLVLCLSRHDAGTNHPVKSILILNKYLMVGLTIRSQKVPDKFPYTLLVKSGFNQRLFRGFGMNAVQNGRFYTESEDCPPDSPRTDQNGKLSQNAHIIGHFHCITRR